jgi:hypothetical protein
MAWPMTGVLGVGETTEAASWEVLLAQMAAGTGPKIAMASVHGICKRAIILINTLPRPFSF